MLRVTIRSKELKLTYYMGKEYGELYDLKNNPNEFYDLWDKKDYKDIKNRLIKKLLDILIETEDKKLKRQSNY